MNDDEPTSNRPAGADPAKEDVRSAIQEMLEFKKIENIDPDDVAKWIRDGRR